MVRAVARCLALGCGGMYGGARIGPDLAFALAPDAGVEGVGALAAALAGGGAGVPGRNDGSIGICDELDGVPM